MMEDLIIISNKSIINLNFEDGSIGSIHYFANGGKSFPKERIEVFCDNSTIPVSYTHLRAHET